MLRAASERRLTIRRFSGLGFGVGALGWPLGRFVPIAGKGEVGREPLDGMGDLKVNWACRAARRKRGIGDDVSASESLLMGRESVAVF
jgi:hypothetical protein